MIALAATSSRTWAAAAAALAVLWIIGCSLLAAWLIFNLGAAYGRYEVTSTTLGEQLEATKAEAGATADMAARVEKAITHAAATAKRAQASQRQVQEEFNAYVQAHPKPDCVLPADFGRVWNAASAAAHPTTAQPSHRADGGLRAPATTEGLGAEQPAGESPADDQPLPNVRGPAAGAGGVDTSSGARQ